jgi:tetratricopeptide (TPR) repeat protein
LSSFIEAALSSNGDLMHLKLRELAEHAARENSFQCWFDLGVLAHRFFFNQAAAEYYEHSLELAETVGDPKKAAKALNNLGSLYAEVEDWDRAGDCYTKGLDYLERSEDNSSMASVLSNLGDVFLRRGEHERALECYQKALIRLKDSGDCTGAAEALNSLGRAHQLKGDLGLAEVLSASLSETEPLATRRCQCSKQAQFTCSTDPGRGP